HQHSVGRQDFFGTRNHFRAAAAVFIRLTHLGGHHFHAFDFAVADTFDRLTVKQALHTFLTGIHHFARGARHVGFVAAVRTGHAVGTLTDRSTVTVHGGITTTQHHHFFTRHADEIRRVFFKAQVVVDVGNQEIQRIHHTRQVFTGEAAFHVGVGTHTQEDGVEFFDQAVEIDVFAHFSIQAELNPHTFKDFAAIGHHTLFQLELGNTEGEQTTDFRVFIEY